MLTSIERLNLPAGFLRGQVVVTGGGRGIELEVDLARLSAERIAAIEALAKTSKQYL